MTLIKLTREEFENTYFKETPVGNEIIDREYAIYLSKE